MKESIEDILCRLYKASDTALEQYFKTREVACRKGCCYCCSLYVLTTIADAVNITSEVLSWSDWKAWAIKFSSIARLQTQKGMNSRIWAEQPSPCVFLENSLCKIYKQRPAECRFYYVAQNSDNCDLRKGVMTVARYDLYSLEQRTWEVSIHIQKEIPDLIGPPPLIAAPLPLMILHAMKAGFKKSRRHREYIEKLLVGLPSPEEFINSHLEQFETKFGREEAQRVVAQITKQITHS